MSAALLEPDDDNNEERRPRPRPNGTPRDAQTPQNERQRPQTPKEPQTPQARVLRPAEDAQPAQPRAPLTWNLKYSFKEPFPIPKGVVCLANGRLWVVAWIDRAGGTIRFVEHFPEAKEEEGIETVWGVLKEARVLLDRGDAGE